MSRADDVARFRANLQDEIDSATLYRTMAEAEREPKLAEVYRKLADVEERHAAFWEERLRAQGAPVPDRRASRRSRVLAWMARRFGPQMVLPSVVAGEAQGSSGYSGQAESRGTAMPGEEASHRRVLSTILRGTSGGLEGSTLARLEGRHRAMGGNALRAAVLGANDGLVSNLSLVMGVAGAALADRADPRHRLRRPPGRRHLDGARRVALRAELARARTSARSTIESDELAAHPEEEQEELALIYRGQGARRGRRARNRRAPHRRAPRTPSTPSPARSWGSIPRSSAARPGRPPSPRSSSSRSAPSSRSRRSSSSPGRRRSPSRSASRRLALFGIGAAITLLTGRRVLGSGFRQVLFGLAAATFTFLVGRLLGVALAG